MSNCFAKILFVVNRILIIPKVVSVKKHKKGADQWHLSRKNEDNEKRE